MAESTLSLGRPDLRSAIGYYLGYGRDSNDWTTSDADDIDAALDSGLRRFYVPPKLGASASHRWSFLRPNTTITTVVDQSTYDLPDAFGYILGDITFPEDSPYPGVKIISDAELRNMQVIEHDSHPSFAVIRNKTTGGADGQRKEIVFYPTPSEVWILGYQYGILMDKLTASVPYPAGGMEYAECIKASCLAAAEKFSNDEYGVHNDDFLELLSTCISLDQQNNRTEYFGNLHDPSIEPMFNNGNYDSYYKGRPYMKRVSVNGVFG